MSSMDSGPFFGAFPLLSSSFTMNAFDANLLSEAQFSSVAAFFASKTQVVRLGQNFISILALDADLRWIEIERRNFYRNLKEVSLFRMQSQGDILVASADNGKLYFLKMEQTRQDRARRGQFRFKLAVVHSIQIAGVGMHRREIGHFIRCNESCNTVITSALEKNLCFFSISYSDSLDIGELIYANLPMDGVIWGMEFIASTSNGHPVVMIGIGKILALVQINTQEITNPIIILDLMQLNVLCLSMVCIPNGNGIILLLEDTLIVVVENESRLVEVDKFDLSHFSNFVRLEMEERIYETAPLPISIHFLQNNSSTGLLSLESGDLYLLNVHTPSLSLSLSHLTQLNPAKAIVSLQHIFNCDNETYSVLSFGDLSDMVAYEFTRDSEEIHKITTIKCGSPVLGIELHRDFSSDLCLSIISNVGHQGSLCYLNFGTQCRDLMEIDAPFHESISSLCSLHLETENFMIAFNYPNFSRFLSFNSHSYNIQEISLGGNAINVHYPTRYFGRLSPVMMHARNYFIQILDFDFRIISSTGGYTFDLVFHESFPEDFKMDHCISSDMGLILIVLSNSKTNDCQLLVRWFDLNSEFTQTFPPVELASAVSSIYLHSANIWIGDYSGNISLFSIEDKQRVSLRSSTSISSFFSDKDQLYIVESMCQMRDSLYIGLRSGALLRLSYSTLGNFFPFVIELGFLPIKIIEYISDEELVIQSDKSRLWTLKFESNLLLPLLRPVILEESIEIIHSIPFHNGILGICAQTGRLHHLELSQSNMKEIRSVELSAQYFNVKETPRRLIESLVSESHSNSIVLCDDKFNSAPSGGKLWSNDCSIQRITHDNEKILSMCCKLFI